MGRKGENQETIEELEEKLRSALKLADWFYCVAEHQTKWKTQQLEIKYKELQELYPPPDRKAYHHRNQMIYDRIDPMSTEELKRIRGKLKKNYEDLFDSSGTLKNNRAAKLERLYSVIDLRIGENLKLWR